MGMIKPASILKPKERHHCSCGQGFVPDPSAVAHSAPPDSLAPLMDGRFAVQGVESKIYSRMQANL